MGGWVGEALMIKEPSTTFSLLDGESGVVTCSGGSAASMGQRLSGTRQAGAVAGLSPGGWDMDVIQTGSTHTLKWPTYHSYCTASMGRRLSGTGQAGAVAGVSPGGWGMDVVSTGEADTLQWPGYQRVVR